MSLEFLVLSLFVLGLVLLFYRGNHLLRLISPNYAAVKVEGAFNSRRRIVLRVRTPMIASQWASEPPRLDLRGLEGLAWLAEQGCFEARDHLFSRALPARANFLEIQSAVADTEEFYSSLVDMIIRMASKCE